MYVSGSARVRTDTYACENIHIFIGRERNRILQLTLSYRKETPLSSSQAFTLAVKISTIASKEKKIPCKLLNK